MKGKSLDRMKKNADQMWIGHQGNESMRRE